MSLYFFGIVMTTLGDAPLNDVLELTTKNTLSSTGVENPERTELLYDNNLYIPNLDMPQNDSESGLGSFGDDENFQMSDIVIHVTSLARVEYN